MKVIGITGGIGSGKSTAAVIFEHLGYLVYRADDRSKFLLMNDERVIEAVRNEFGEKIMGEDNRPDKKALAALVFKRPKKLAALNAILHPAVKTDFETWLTSLSADYSKTFVLKEAAILFESGTHKQCDRVIEVFAPQSLRLQRVMDRDKVKAKEVLARMERQWPEQEKVLASDFVIFNDGAHALIPQVMTCAEWIIKSFQSSPTPA
jgi:dephospho-CoA kinase